MSIEEARATMVAAFNADPNFRRGYVDNIAMRLYDAADHLPEVFGEENPFSIGVVRNNIASSILDLIFK